ncbi:MAG: hypothetical protein ABIG68_05690 [Acidobacteriota bacterium]
MTLSTGDLLARVRAAGGEVIPAGDCLRIRAPKALPADLLAELTRHKGEILAELSTRLRPYWGRLQQARDWSDLTELLNDAQEDFADGRLSGDEVERLAVQCRVRARTLPQTIHSKEGV